MINGTGKEKETYNPIVDEDETVIVMVSTLLQFHYISRPLHSAEREHNV